MATQTSNLGLKKPAGTDFVQVNDFNENSNIIDRSVGNLSELRTSVKSSLVEAVNEAMISGGTDSPYINESNGHWMQWNNELLKFEDTGIVASGVVADGLLGFDVDPDSGQLRLYYTGETPPDFEIDADGHLIYKLNPDVSVDIGKVQGPQGDPGITTMTQTAYDAAVAAGTVDADTWYGVYPEEG